MAFGAFRIAGVLTAAALLGGGLWAWDNGIPSAFAPPGPTYHLPPPGFAPGPEPPVTVWVLGTSLSATGDWPGLLAERLRACRTGPVTVESLARPGATSRWGRQRLAEALAERPAPDLVLVELAINDAWLRRGLSLRESRENHAGLLESAGRAGVPVLFLTMNPAWGRPGLERPGLPAYLATLVGHAEAGRAGIVDTIPVWRSLDPARRDLLVPDGLHPSPAAMAEILVPPLAAALAPGLCATA